MNPITDTPAAPAVATSSIVQCCTAGGAPLPGTQFWTCPGCHTTWDCAGFEDLPYGARISLEPYDG